MSKQAFFKRLERLLVQPFLFEKRPAGQHLLFFVLIFWVVPLQVFAQNPSPVLSNSVVETTTQIEAETLTPQALVQKTQSEATIIPNIIGVLALNSKEEALVDWQPLAEYLNRRLAPYQFKIEALGFDEVLPAVAESKMDYLIANPAFYVMAHKNHDTYALATLVRHSKQFDASQFGGVIFSRLGVDVEDIAKLHQEDIAAVAPYSLGGYLVQKQALKDNFRLTLNDRRVQFYESHKDVVNAVLSGERKVGFVRTGILEEMQQEGMFEILTFASTPKAGYKLSTPLYPEWPFAALKHVPTVHSEKVLQVLLDWQHALHPPTFSQFNHAIGWTVPMSYEPIVELLKTFHVSPYVDNQPIVFQNWIENYQDWALFLLAILLGLILMTSLLNRGQLLVDSKRQQLHREVNKRDELIKQLQLANQSLEFQQERFQVLSDRSSEGVVIFSFSGHIEYINPHALNFWGKEHATLERLNAYHLFSEVDDRQKIHQMLESLNETTQSPVFLQEMTPKLVSSDGTVKSTRMRVSALYHKDRWLLVINFSDSSEQKHLEKAYRQAMFLAQTYMNVSGQTIFTFNQRFELQSVNSQACELFSAFMQESLCEHKDMESQPLKSIAEHHFDWIKTWFSESEQADLLLLLKEAAREDKASSFDYMVPETHSGVFAGYQFHISYIHNPLLEEAFYLCVAHDSSHLKEMQKSLLLSNQDFNTVVTRNRTGILILDKKGIIRFVNPAVEALMGLPSNELLNSHFGIPYGLDETIRHEFDIVTADGSTGVAELAYTETEWNGEKGYLVLMYDITELKAAKQEANYQALHDALTGLPNRRLFIQNLDNLIQSNRLIHQPFAVVFLDVNRFKVLNDTLGHRLGDELLVQVVQRLKSALRASDTIARMGSDEFTLLLPGVDSEEMLHGLTQKVLRAFTTKFALGDSEVLVSFSMGAVLHPKYGKNSVELLKMADLAMYHAKTLPNINCVIFEDNIMSASDNAFSLESELNRAVVQKEFILLYQPQIDARTGELVGMEALMRWQNPKRGLLSPDLFIPLLETTGKIVEIGAWVLELALLKIKEWALHETDIRLAINVSAIQLLNTDFAQKLEERFTELAVSPRHLAIEVTESVLLKDPHHVIMQLQRMSQLGIEVHMDDFGTGYSSLARLKQLPFDSVKIDKAFVQELAGDSRDQVMIKAIVDSVHAFGMMVIAEGVETEQQKAALLEIGCWQHQGYLYDKPLPESVFLENYLKK